MAKNIIVAIPGFIWENFPYSVQGFYICKMMSEYNFNITCISFGTLSNQEYEMKTFGELYKNRQNISNISDPDDIENLKIFNSINYYILESKNNDNIIFSSKYNKIINKVNADYLFILGDFYRYFIDEQFCCKTIAWYPNHFEPIDIHTANILKNFDKVLCLYPSAVNIIKKSVQNTEITCVPHVIELNNQIYQKKI
jgi:hypothetical protein